MNTIKENQLRYLEYIHRENAYRHHRYDEEMLQYYLLRDEDAHALEESRHMWNSGLVGQVHSDVLKNRKYLFVASITLACLFAILGGLEEQRAYDISDLYIQQVDQCTTLDAITALHEDMFAFYLKEVVAAKRKTVYSVQVLRAMDFIHYHLHEKLTVRRIANELRLAPNYLCSRKNEGSPWQVMSRNNESKPRATCCASPSFLTRISPPSWHSVLKAISRKSSKNIPG